MPEVDRSIAVSNGTPETSAGQQPIAPPPPGVGAAEILASQPPIPPAARGMTASAPLNLAVGGGWALGSNAVTTGQAGVDTSGLAFITTLLFNGLKKWERFDQHRWSEYAILVIAIGLAVGVAMLSHADLGSAITKAGWIAWQAIQNYVGQKASGLGGLAPATNPP